MRKEKMVTRTIVTTTATVLAMDITTASAKTESYSIAGTFPDNTTLLKKLQKVYDTDIFKVVAITESQQVEKLYGMSETDFLKYAKELPPRTKQEQEQE